MFLTAMLVASGCQKKETVSSNAAISDQFSAEKEFNGIKITLDENWKKLSREGDTVTYLYDEGKTTDQTKDVTLRMYAPYLTGTAADRHEYLEYVVHEENPELIQAKKKKVGDALWQTYTKEETVAGVDYEETYYTYASESGSVMLVLSHLTETDVEDLMNEILASVDAGTEEPYKVKASDSLWIQKNEFYLSASTWKQVDDTYQNGDMKLTIANDSEETSQTMKQKMGNPADEEKMNVKDRTFDLLLYNKESNTMIDQDMVFVLDDNGCMLQFAGENLENYLENIKMIVRSCALSEASAGEAQADTEISETDSQETEQGAETTEETEQ